MLKLLKFNHKTLLLLIILFAVLTRLIRLDYPNAYVFDEVYHAFTAKEYLKNSSQAWEYWANPPSDVAYEWTHPPLAKEIMTASMFIMQSTDAWAWRLPSALLGIFNIFLVFKLAEKLFNNRSISLLSAFIFSLDGLTFVQSRTGMNDTYLQTFILVSLIFFLTKKYFLSSLFLGLALATKWTAVYLLGIYIVLIFISLNPLSKIILFYNFIKALFNQGLKIISIKNLPSLRFKIPLTIFCIFLVPPIIYGLTYLPFFTTGHNITQFMDTQKQMWWYHTNLKATHDYASPWWSWPLNLYPVWFYVEYHTNNTISNIFTTGNSTVYWAGIAAIFVSLVELIRNRSKSLSIVLLCYFAFWLPWSLAPRIMFLYHYSPTIPFLSIILSYQLNSFLHDRSDRYKLIFLLVLFFINFLIYYPVLTGIPLPKQLLVFFFMTNLTKNPF